MKELKDHCERCGECWKCCMCGSICLGFVSYVVGFFNKFSINSKHCRTEDVSSKEVTAAASATAATTLVAAPTKHSDNNNDDAICNSNVQVVPIFGRSFRRSSGRHRRLTKDDIKYLIEQTSTDCSQTSSSSVTRLDSLTSRTSAGSGTDANFYRDRIDSDRSQESASSLNSNQNPSSVFERIRTYSFTSGTTGGTSRQQPIVDMRPIEFWTSTREQIQPRLTRLKLLSESGISLEDFQQELYMSSSDTSTEHPQQQQQLNFTIQQSNPQPQFQQLKQKSSTECPDEARKAQYHTETIDSLLSDEEKLEKFQLGQIHIGLQYIAEDETLSVKIIEARSLPLPLLQDQCDLSHSNPYVKVSLVNDSEDKTNNGWQQNQQQPQALQQLQRQTSVRRKTQNPVWEEKFYFRLAFKEIVNSSLHLTLKDFDKYSRHCSIGQAVIDLGEVNVIKGGHFWKALTPSEPSSTDFGTLLVSLNFLPTAGRLNVDVIRAQQILQTDLINGTDSFVKVTQFHDNKEVRNRKTSFVRGTLDPEYDESLSFDVRSDQLANCTLIFSIWSRQSGHSRTRSKRSTKKLIGRFSMGKYSSGGREQAHWNCLVRYNRSPAARWHALLSEEECELKCALSAYLT